MRVSVSSGLSDITEAKDMCSIYQKAKGDIFTATQCLNCTLALMCLNYENLIVIYHTLVEICKSNQAEMLTTLKLL